MFSGIVVSIMTWFFQHIWKLIIQPGRGKQVFVGVSGGVDSSVAALLLKLYGYKVTGVFIRTWQPDWIECTWRDERRDAMRVCAHLEIPFLELDLEQEYKNGVADYMIAEYRKGRTPNPDVMCNREVKFGGFLHYAIEQGADYVATGHYAQNSNNQLVKGVDNGKDQSYFLWTLTQEQLQYILFPVGHLPKSITRIIASWYRLPTAQKKDSQGICFIGEIDMKDFLGHYIAEKQGHVLNEQGNVIGFHSGALLFTLGERHGFTITEKTTDDRPYYVVHKDIENNTITVSHTLHQEKVSQKITIRECIWRIIPQESMQYTAQIRYHGDLKECSIVLLNQENAEVYFSEYDGTIAQGQSVVVFKGDVCIGGGIVQ